ncbi:MAG TPA: rhodanese-like domain-containing protein [Actinomycetota bacterium]|nr:rhodanese-like domain-containing protein [Actinomycetota bacterium]
MAVDVAVVPLVDEGLGNSAYLVDLGDNRALVVDASRDLRAVRAAAEERNLRVAFAADTHLHADFLSGARQLAASDGATVLASAAGGREFGHTRLSDGDEVDLGGLRLRALGTPGHTDEHLAFVLLDGQRPLGVFTGGSLLVGAAARTDLVDPERTEELARAQYRSVLRLLTLPDEVAVWPTHGPGSFCSAPTGAERTSSIGREKATNTLLRAADEDGFVASLLGSLGSFPPYFLRLAEINRRGPAPTDPRPLRPLDPTTVSALLAGGAAMVDVRPVGDFAAGHVPGALSVALRGSFATWLGWLLPPRQQIVVLRNPDQDPDEIVWQATKIGRDNVDAELLGGIESWAAAGLPVSTIRLVEPGGIAGHRLLDVRLNSEFIAGHVPGAAHIELGDLSARLDDLPAGPLAVMCGHGERAMTAASVMERAGRRDLIAVAGGPPEWSAGSGAALEKGQ